MRKQRNKVSLSLSKSLGIKRKFDELQVTVEQSFSDSQSSKKRESEEKIQKKVGRRERQRLTEKEDDRKRRTHKRVRK